MYVYDVPPRVTAELKRSLPEWIADVRYGDSYDAEGNSVLLVFLVVGPEGKHKLKDARNLYDARDIVAEVFARQFDPSFWPYVRFVTEAELQPGLRV